MCREKQYSAADLRAVLVPVLQMRKLKYKDKLTIPSIVTEAF